MASMIENNFSDDSEEMSDSSDVALQEAFARGELKPGLVVLGKKGEKSEEKKRPVINNVPVLLAKFEEIKLPSDLNWVERLDIINDLAPLAPEIAFQLDDHKEKREKEIKLLNARKLKKKTNVVPTIKSIDDDLIHNDFKREMTFYRQAQEAIMKCLPRLKSMKVPTRRPEDYFAEMAKSDMQMQKVAQVLLKKQTATEKAEKVRKIRDQKKFSKQTQVHVLQERQKAKKELNENIKKYRKGQKNTLDFLEEAKGTKKSERGASLGKERDEKPRVNKKRLMKDEKYGYGGPKKGSKWNTKESLDNFEAEIHSRGGSRGRGTTRGRGSSRGRGDSRGRSSSGGRGGSQDRGDSSSRGRGGGSRGRGGFRGGMSRGGRGDSRGGGRDFSGGRGGRGGRGDSRGGSRDFSGGRGGRGGRGDSRGGRGGRGDSRGGGRDFSGGRGGRGGGGRGRRDFSGDRGGGRGGGGRGRGGRGGNRPGKDARNNLRAGVKR